jgi:hypothetical protein
MRIGIEPTKGMTFMDKAKLDNTIGPVGWTVVKPINANTTMYNAAPMDTKDQP